jgi:WD repeat-containing protein 35
VVYAFSQVGRDDQCVMFWDTATDGRHLKHVHGLLALSGAGEFCALVAAAPAPEEGAPAPAGRFIVVLCNSIGSAVETRYINVEPMHMCMTPSCVVVASRDALYMWSYRAGGGAGARGGGGGGAAAAAGAASPPAARRDVGVGKERVFSVADVSVGATAASSGEGEGGAARLAGGDGDICCVAASARWLLVGRESGAVQLFSLPGMVLEQKFQLRVRPASLQLNCDGTRFSVIDDSCTLSFFDMTRQVTNASGGISVGEHLEFEKAGVWVGARCPRAPCKYLLPYPPPPPPTAQTPFRRASCGPRTTPTCGPSWRRRVCTSTAGIPRRSP